MLCDVATLSGVPAMSVFARGLQTHVDSVCLRKRTVCIFVCLWCLVPSYIRIFEFICVYMCVCVRMYLCLCVCCMYVFRL